jgi:hypothetical protein
VSISRPFRVAGRLGVTGTGYEVTPGYRMNDIRPIPVIEGLFAATATIHRPTLVTRNDREDFGAAVLNPFRFGESRRPSAGRTRGVTRPVFLKRENVAMREIRASFVNQRLRRRSPLLGRKI